MTRERKTPSSCRECSAECWLWAKCNLPFRAEPNAELEALNAIDRARRDEAESRRMAADLEFCRQHDMSPAEDAAINEERLAFAQTRMGAFDRMQHEAAIQRENHRW